VIDKLGGKSIATGILGGDTGRAIQSAIEKLGITSDFKFVEGETRTNLKVIDPVNHTNTDINEPGITITEEILDSLLDNLLGKINGNDIVVLSGSLPKGAPKNTYEKWVKACREKGAKVILDADGEMLAAGLKASPYLVKPNDIELSGLLGRTLTTPEELKEAAINLMEQYGLGKVVVSMGGKGALYVTGNDAVYAQGLKVPVGSTVGAGDSVVAALAVAEEAGMSLEEAVRLSTATGAANVMCSGSQAAEYSTIQELMPKVSFQKI
jgi:1-phosphofructokinase